MSISPDTVHTAEIAVAHLPTKSVTFAPAKATVVREIHDVHIKVNPDPTSTVYIYRQFL
jgi:hypothetical protein